MAQNRHWTEVAETISLIASAGGAIVSVILEQVAYLAAPVTLALVLNLVNRQRLEQGVEHQSREEITLLQSSVSEELEALRASVLGIAAHIDMGGMRRAITTLEEGLLTRLERLEIMDQQALQADINQLKNQSSYLLEALANILQRLNENDGGDRWQNFESRLTQLTTEVTTLQTHLQNRLTPLEETIYNTSQNLAPIRESLTNLEQYSQQSSSQTFEPLITEIHQKLTAFETVSQRITSLEINLTTLTTQVHHVQDELQTRLAALDLETLQTSAQQLESMQTTITHLGEQSQQLLTALVQVTDRLESLSLPSPSLTSEQLDSRLNPLTTYLQQLQHEVTVLKDHSPQNLQTEFQATRTELSQLKHQSQQIQTQLETLTTRFDQSPKSSDHPAIEDRFTQLRTQYAALQNTLDKLTGKLINSSLGENGTTHPDHPETSEPRDSETWFNRFLDRVRNVTSTDQETAEIDEDFADFDEDEEAIDFSGAIPTPTPASPQTPLESPSTPSNSPWQCIHTLTGNTSAVTALAIDPTGQTAISGDRETIRFWHLSTGQLNQTLSTQSGVSITSIALNPKGDLLACANGNIELWNLKTSQLERTLEPEDWTTIVAISPDGKTLASAGGDPLEQNSSIHLWDLETGEIIRTNYYVECEINALRFSTDGQLLAIGGGNPDSRKGMIQVWSLGYEKNILTLEPQAAIYSVVVSPDHQWVLGAGSDQTIKLWNLATRGLVRTFSGHTGEVYAIALNPENNLLASASNDQTLKLWNWETGDLLTTLAGHLAGVKTLAFTPNSQILVSGSQDMTLKIWQNQSRV